MEYTFKNILKKQDLETFELLEQIFKRPGLYVGSPRFDYVNLYIDGFCDGRRLETKLLPSKELQFWLLHTQSSSLHGTITGGTLFYRCFGVNKHAFENYKVFLNAPLPKEFQYVDEELYSYEKEHDIVKYKNESNEAISHNIELAKSIYSNIEKMINRSSYFFDEIKIYIKKERLFNQVRFMFKTNNEWIPDDEIIRDKANHDLLISIHATVRNATVENLRNCGYDVFESQNNYLNNLGRYDVFHDDLIFLTEYTKWKNNVLTKV